MCAKSPAMKCSIIIVFRPQSRATDQSDCRIAGGLFPRRHLVAGGLWEIKSKIPVQKLKLVFHACRVETERFGKDDFFVRARRGKRRGWYSSAIVGKAKL